MVRQGRTEESIGRGVIDNLHSEIEDYDKELRKTELELEQLMSRKEWLDWISAWGESLKIESKSKVLRMVRVQWNSVTMYCKFNSVTI